MNIVAMIPARSGSKGLPDKNIKNLCGQPVMSYSIEAALQCDAINEVYVNSDSQEYLNIAMEFGSKPYLRKNELAGDTVAMNSVVRDFAESLNQQGKAFDALCLLYPIYPTRTAENLNAVIQAYTEGGGRPMVGMKEPAVHPYLCYEISNDGHPKSVIDFDINKHYRRQTYPEYYEFSLWACVLPMGSISTLNAQLMNEQSIGYKIPKEVQIVDIDTPTDFEYAEFLMSKKNSGQRSRA